MLKIALGFAAAAVALAYFAPQLLLSQPPGGPAAPRVAVAESAPQATEPWPSRQREQSIAADAGGQYSVDALVGGQSVHMLVDTGATMVVISAALADRLGLRAQGGRKWRVRTANGEAIATETVLPSVDLGSIYMPNVTALIADPGAGEVNLLGASFLRRLASVESRNGVLILRQ